MCRYICPPKSSYHIKTSNIRTILKLDEYQPTSVPVQQNLPRHPSDHMHRLTQCGASEKGLGSDMPSRSAAYLKEMRDLERLQQYKRQRASSFGLERANQLRARQSTTRAKREAELADTEMEAGMTPKYELQRVYEAVELAHAAAEQREELESLFLQETERSRLSGRQRIERLKAELNRVATNRETKMNASNQKKQAAVLRLPYHELTAAEAQAAKELEQKGHEATHRDDVGSILSAIEVNEEEVEVLAEADETQQLKAQLALRNREVAEAAQRQADKVAHLSLQLETLIELQSSEKDLLLKVMEEMDTHLMARVQAETKAREKDTAGLATRLEALEAKETQRLLDEEDRVAVEEMSRIAAEEARVAVEEVKRAAVEEVRLAAAEEVRRLFVQQEEAQQAQREPQGTCSQEQKLEQLILQYEEMSIKIADLKQETQRGNLFQWFR
ncbi:hypothetical protein CYMTET_43032 [Cymbomonas tetramitiformis]|uniref:Uncharacterized protein n=1 Tax=Cymbomonas tetramitiformis TaxID=36881 RepID=A0AAE0C533_9CHLO|nr:hypothetical protein CYMTET_43032 [Cymbomonas tetramitiformis]